MWNELTFLWNELTILWNDLTTDWNDLTMERNDRIPPHACSIGIMNKERTTFHVSVFFSTHFIFR